MMLFIWEVGGERLSTMHGILNLHLEFLEQLGPHEFLYIERTDNDHTSTVVESARDKASD